MNDYECLACGDRSADIGSELCDGCFAAEYPEHAAIEGAWS
ncbi:MAG: hypothetical protein OXG44_17365 [Gammaproteobacteria bacterium]|nr:hypothetical protein [Gammaproteobacteria bacterium]